MEAETLAPFAIVPRGRFAPVDRLELGEISLCRNGTATFRAEDLADVGIVESRCVVLVDPGTFRIAVRAHRSGEEEQTVRVCTATRKGKATGRKRVGLARAIKRCDLTTEAVAARYNLHRKDKDHDGLLIIQLLDGPLGDKKQKAK